MFVQYIVPFYVAAICFLLFAKIKHFFYCLHTATLLQSDYADFGIYNHYNDIISTLATYQHFSYVILSFSFLRKTKSSCLSPCLSSFHLFLLASLTCLLFLSENRGRFFFQTGGVCEHYRLLNIIINRNYQNIYM